MTSPFFSTQCQAFSIMPPLQPQHSSQQLSKFWADNNLFSWPRVLIHSLSPITDAMAMAYNACLSWTTFFCKNRIVNISNYNIIFKLVRQVCKCVVKESCRTFAFVFLFIFVLVYLSFNKIDGIRKQLAKTTMAFVGKRTFHSHQLIINFVNIFTTVIRQLYFLMFKRYWIKTMERNDDIIYLYYGGLISR